MSDYEPNLELTEEAFNLAPDDMTTRLTKAIQPDRRPNNLDKLTPDSMHHKVVTFGKYRGERWTRVPLAFLRWCVNQLNDPAKTLAELELKRRGATNYTVAIELSAHSIDRASVQLYDVWQATREENEGLHTWLAKTAKEAYDYLGIESFDEASNGERSQDVETCRNGIKYVFMIGRYYPVLKTVNKI